MMIHTGITMLRNALGYPEESVLVNCSTGGIPEQRVMVFHGEWKIKLWLKWNGNGCLPRITKMMKGKRTTPSKVKVVFQKTLLNTLTKRKWTILPEVQVVVIYKTLLHIPMK
jgi:hypothetical protein